MEPKPKKLLEQVREVMRLRHYDYRTEETYTQWIKRYILFHQERHPREMGRNEIEAFLTDLAVNQQVAAATQFAGGFDESRSVGSHSTDDGCSSTGCETALWERLKAFRSPAIARQRC